MSYIDIIKDKARADKKTIVMPETNDKRTLIEEICSFGEYDYLVIDDVISCNKEGFAICDYAD